MSILGNAVESGGRGIVLRYHRVAELSSDPNAISTRPDRFRAQMRLIRERYRPVGLDELVGDLSRGRVPDGAVAVTFDDGYEDNLTRAAPVLEEFGIPATIFVVTGYVGREREFWWDELEKAILTPGVLPGRLELRDPGGVFRFDLGTEAEYSVAEAGLHSDWSWRSAGDPTSRHGLFRRLSAHLRPMPPVQRDHVLEHLMAWAGCPRIPRETHRVLTGEQLRAIAGKGLISIGAHSMTHPVLSRLPARHRRDEVFGSKQFLEHLLEKEVRSFAYPYGVAGRSRRQVRRAGFHSAWGTRPGPVSRRCHPYELPRVYVGNWGADQFIGRLESCA